MSFQIAVILVLFSFAAKAMDVGDYIETHVVQTEIVSKETLDCVSKSTVVSYDSVKDIYSLKITRSFSTGEFQQDFRPFPGSFIRTNANKIKSKIYNCRGTKEVSVIRGNLVDTCKIIESNFGHRPDSTFWYANVPFGKIKSDEYYFEGADLEMHSSMEMLDFNGVL